MGQKFTRVKRPQTNGKAERVIRTLMEMWHEKTTFTSREHRNKGLIRFINYYNTVKPHKGIDGKTPYEKLLDYFEFGKKNFIPTETPLAQSASALMGGGSLGMKFYSHGELLKKLINVNNATISYK